MSKAARSSIASVVAKQTLAHGESKSFNRELAAYLLAEGRVSELAPLLRDVQSKWADEGYVNAIAISAHSLSEESKSKIEHALKPSYPKAKRIVISESRDQEVLGGVRIELADSQLDLSVATKLNKFKHLSTGKD